MRPHLLTFLMLNTEAIGSGAANAVRGGSLRWSLFFFTLGTGAIVAWIPWVKFPRQVRHAPALEVVAWLVVVAVAILTGCVRALRMGLLLDSAGVLVRNYLRTYRFTWPELKCFTDGAVWADGHSGWVWALGVMATDGRAMSATGAALKKPEVLATVRRAAESHGIPFEVTGTPVRRGRSRLVVNLTVTAVLLFAAWIAPNALNN